MAFGARAQTEAVRSAESSALLFAWRFAGVLASALQRNLAGRIDLCLWLGLLACLISQAAAQTPAGGLRGKVLDADFSQPLPNVTVRVEDTGQAVQTDASGNYFFNELAPGTYSISASRSGYRTQAGRRVAIASGGVAEASFQLTGEVVELDDFVVTAEDLIGSETAQLLDIRANLASFTDVLGAEFISQSGGSDVGDVVKRIVGTSVADSRYVVIRGLSDRYNTVLLNGARIPSSDPDRRAVNIDIFPSSLVAELTNTKTFTPDLAGEATGGSINIVTKSSPEKSFVKASVSTAYNTQATGNRGFVTYPGAGTGVLGTENDRRIPGALRSFTTATLPIIPSTPAQLANARFASSLLNRNTGTTTATPPLDFGFNISAGLRLDNFLGGPLGLLGAFTYSKKYDFDPDVGRSKTVIRGPAGSRAPVRTQEFLSQEGTQTLLSGLLLSAGWEPTPNDRIKLTFFTNVAADDRAYFQEGLVLNATDQGPGLVPIEEAEQIAVREGLQYVERRLRTLQLTGTHQFPGTQDAALHWGAAYSLSSQDEPDGRFTSVLFSRPDQAFFPLPEFSGDNFVRYWRRLDDTNYNVLAELKIPLFRNAAGDEKALLRVGANFDYSTRDFRADTFGYSNSILGGGFRLVGTLGPSNRDGLTPADVIGSGSAPLGRRRNPEIYEASQTIAAGYAMSEFNVSRNLRVTVGLRAEVTDIRVARDRAAFFGPTGNLVGSEGPITNPLTGERLPLETLGRADIEEVNVLPAVNTVWDVAKDMKLRFAASRTVARPSFKELAPVFLDDPISAARFSGNVLVKTSSIDNVDLRYEWFPGAGDVIAVSGFTKFIQRPIELFTSPSFDFFANQESAVIYGYEFEAQKNLGFLSAELRHVSLGLNGARFYSEVELLRNSRQARLDSGLDPVRRLQGQPDYLLNFNLTFDHKESGLFAGIFFNVTGETLAQAGSAEGGVGFSADTFQQPFTSLDFTLSKKFGDQYTVTFRAENLLNQELLRTAEGNRDFAKSSGTKYSLSIGGAW
jgi:outer membrane receptor protein involved in Fe transport